MKPIQILMLCLICFASSLRAHAEIELKDLGMTEAEVSLSPTEIKSQKTLEKRHHMLKTHELLGLTTLGVMTATFLTGNQGEENDLHMYLGITSGLLYYTTAYYSLNAPKPATIKDRGMIVWHKRLAWVHFPAMVLAPILGYMYKQNEKNDRENSSLVKQHSTVATIGYAAFALSAALMTFEF